MAIALKISSGVIGLIAAVLWFMSAFGKIPPAPGAAIGGLHRQTPSMSRYDIRLS